MKSVFTMKINGKKENCDQWLHRLIHPEEPNGFQGISKIDIKEETSEGSDYCMMITGYHAEPVCDDSFMDMLLDNRTDGLFAHEAVGHRFVSPNPIEINTRDLKLEAEVFVSSGLYEGDNAYSGVRGVYGGVQEYIHYINGECVGEETAHFSSYFWDKDMYSTFDEYKKSLGLPEEKVINEADFDENGCYIEGGFKKYNFVTQKKRLIQQLIAYKNEQKQLAKEQAKEKKYEIIKDAPDWQVFNINGHKLYPIRALKDIRNVRKGEIGGCIEREANLSQEDNSWVARTAMVYGNARVYENAYIADGARIYDNAKVYGNAVVEHGNDEIAPEIYGNTEVYGNAHVVHDAKIYGEAKICGDADISFGGDYIVIQGLSYGRSTITAFRDSSLGVAVNLPKFFGSLSEFEAQTKANYADRKNPDFCREFIYLNNEYTAAAALIKTHFTEFHYNANMPFSKQLKAARHRLGLSQRQLANILRTEQRSIERWEAGDALPPFWSAELLLEKLANL